MLKNKLKIRKRIRSKVVGSAERPRLHVTRTNKSMFVQAIDDNKGHTIAGISAKAIKEKASKTEKATLLGEKIADILISQKIKKVVFDRGYYPYHGRVKAVAEGARKKGLEF